MCQPIDWGGHAFAPLCFCPGTLAHLWWRPSSNWLLLALNLNQTSLRSTVLTLRNILCEQETSRKLCHLAPLAFLYAVHHHHCCGDDHWSCEVKKSQLAKLVLFQRFSLLLHHTNISMTLKSVFLIFCNTLFLWFRASFASLFRHLTLNVDWLLASASVARDAIWDFPSRRLNTINGIFRCFAHHRQPPPCLSLWHMSLPASKYKKILYVDANGCGMHLLRTENRVKELMYDGIKFYGHQFSRSLGSCVELKQKWAALKLSNFSAVSPSAEP